ncbi:18460_t:CDS:2, partial [Gigaspora rosea]
RKKNELADKDKDDLLIIDNAYDLENDKVVETLFKKLIENTKEINYNKNLYWRYTGNSDLKYVSVIHYIQLLRYDSSKMKASRVVATIHNGDKYHTRDIKKVYVDGHERENMITYCKVILQNMAEYDRLIPKLADADCKVYKKPYLLSDKKRETRLIIQFGANHDGYWDGQKLLFQVKNTIKIFERTHLGYIGVWAFDNATSHKVIALDALVAARMNLKPGGLEAQKIVFLEEYEDDSTLQSEPKKMKQILKERGL